MASKYKTMQDVFKVAFSGEDGKTMLYWILNECGYFSTDASVIRPELIALANRLLLAGGITSPAEAGRYIESIITVAREAERIEDEEDEYGI